MYHTVLMLLRLGGKRLPLSPFTRNFVGVDRNRLALSVKSTTCHQISDARCNVWKIAPRIVIFRATRLKPFTTIALYARLCFLLLLGITPDHSKHMKKLPVRGTGVQWLLRRAFLSFFLIQVCM